MSPYIGVKTLNKRGHLPFSPGQEKEGVTRVFNEQWLRTEYGTAVSVAESASTYRRLMA